MSQRGFFLLVIACSISLGCSLDRALDDAAKNVDFSDVKAASPFNSAASWKLEADVQPKSLDPLEINGRLLDEMQQPIADARVGCWVKTWDHHWKLISKTTSDLNGDYKLDARFIRDLDERYSAIARRHLSSDPFRASLGPMLSGEIEQFGFSVYVFAATPADRVAWVTPQILLSRSQVECNLDLQPTGGSVYGVLYDASGDVVGGQEIKLGGIFQQPSETFLGPYLSPLGISEWKTKTDELGRFRFNHLPPNTEVYVEGVPCWTNSPLRKGPNDQATKSSPVSLREQVDNLVVLSGTVLNSRGEPAVGAIIDVATKQVTVNEQGHYQIEVSPNASLLNVIAPPDSGELGRRFNIDRRALAKRTAQPDLHLVAGRWVSGTVRSASRQKPMKGVIVETNGGRLLGRTDEAGAFRVLVEQDCKTLRLMPGWLSDLELAHYVHQGKSLDVPLPVTDQQETSLGKIDFAESDSQPPLSVNVTFPDGTPVPGAKVRCWAIPKRKLDQQSAKSVLQMQSLDDRYQAFALTYKSGNSKVRACFDYEGDRFVTVVHPEVDPQFFAEVKLNSNDQPLAEVRLQRAVEIEGILTFNDRPIAHGLVRADPIGKDSSDGNFQVLSFLGVSDSAGQYQVLAPDADRYGLNIERGVLTKEAELIGSEPAIAINDAGNGKVTGPPLSILRGGRNVLCRVVNHVGRDVSYANVTLLPEPGQVVLGTIVAQRVGNQVKLFDVPSRPIRVTATLDPIHRPGGSHTKMQATTPVIQASDTETEIVLAPAKFFPLDEKPNP